MLLRELETRCGKCRHGTVLLVARAGRVVLRHGVAVEVPRDFMIPTCDECGAERFDDKLGRELDAAIAKARLMALRAAETTEMEPLPDDEP